jgi:hypothetical protein
MPETFDRDGKTIYVTPCCGKELSKSGYYKHMKKGCPLARGGGSSSSVSSTSFDPPSPSMESPAPSPDDFDDTTPSWATWEPSESVEASESMPSPLRFIAARGSMAGVRNPAEIEAMRQQSRAILALGLTAWDAGATRYARAITEDDEYLISHSDQDKMMVADAQARWLESRGFLVSDVVGDGAIAAALTGWFVIPPIAKATSKAKRGFLSPIQKGRIAVFLGRLPIIGKRLRKRRMKKQVQEIQESEVIE